MPHASGQCQSVAAGSVNVMTSLPLGPHIGPSGKAPGNGEASPPSDTEVLDECSSDEEGCCKWTLPIVGSACRTQPSVVTRLALPHSWSDKSARVSFHQLTSD
jgi:hypothetical protein